MAKQPARYGFRRLGYSSYAEYLESEHWQQVRADYFKSRRKRRHECYICGAQGKPLQLHHKTYLRLGKERPQDLVPLCRDCHELVHKAEKCHWALWDTHKMLREEVRASQ